MLGNVLSITTNPAQVEGCHQDGVDKTPTVQKLMSDLQHL
jgi:hypothetical protein